MRILYYFCPMLFLAQPMFMSLVAQEDRATILGRIVDPNGAVIVGAQITVENIETALKQPPPPMWRATI